MTTLGLIGTGAIGKALAGHLARTALDLAIAHRRDPSALAALASRLGPRVRPTTVRDAAAADIVFLAVPWRQLPDAVADVQPWAGRIVVDPTNAIGPPDFRPADLGGRTSSEVVADLVPGARVVKAFNTLRPEILAADPRVAGGNCVIFLSGDDAGARGTVAQLIARLGFAPVDLGRLTEGGRLQQFPGGPLPTLDLIKQP